MVARATGPGRSAGFTYIGLLLAVVLIGLALSGVGVVWSTGIRREREAQLLFVGDEYRRAIARYYADGGHYPAALADMLQDARFPQVHRQLRRLYADPMTGQADWQLMPAGDGGIMGVASRSTGKPIKVANFPRGDGAFAGTACYCAWQFVYAPQRARLRAPTPTEKTP